MKTKLFFPALCALMMCLVACEPTNDPNNSNGSSTNSKEAFDKNGAVANGVFSVGENKKVKFSRGNLQYQASTNKWRFAEHQYDTIGYSNTNISETYNGWIDLFAWGSGDQPTKRFETDDYSTFVDWGVNVIGKCTPSTFRTLTAEEWNYLFYRRPSAGMLWCRAIVNMVRGIILFPDDYVTNHNYYQPIGIAFPYANSDYNMMPLTAQQWSLIEQYGIVFLPYTGCRTENEYFTENEQEGYCFYWTASKDMPDDRRFGITFYNQTGGPNVHSYDWGGYGEAVRLVHDIE